MEIKVYVIPDALENGYVNQLTSGLSSMGYDITRLKFGKKLFRLIDKSPKANHIVHFRWTHYNILSKDGSTFKSVLKSLVFMYQLIRLKLKKVSIVWTVHNLLHHERHNHRLELFVQKRLVHFYDAIIIDCPSSAEELIRLYKLPVRLRRRIRYISRGSYFGYYPNVVSRETARETLSISPDTFVYLFFGRVRPYKGLTALIDSYSTCGAKNSLLYIVGSPFKRVEGFSKSLEALMSDDRLIRTKLAYVPDEDIQQYMNAADVVVLPFDDILSSGSTMLAMSFGKAIISTAKGCVRDLLDAKGSILTDHANLAKVLVDIQQMDVHAMGAHNRRIAESFTWSRAVRETSELYSKLV